MINKNSTLQELFDYAVSSVVDVESGEKFIVKELFRGFEWSRIPIGNRTKLGSMFFAYAQSTGINDMDPIGKTPQNQQIYRKK